MEQRHIRLVIHLMILVGVGLTATQPSICQNNPETTLIIIILEVRQKYQRQEE